MPEVVIAQVDVQGPGGAQPRAGQIARISAEAVNRGAAAFTGLTVTIVLSDGQQTSESFDLAPGESHWTWFDTRPLPAGGLDVNVTAVGEVDQSSQVLAENGLSVAVEEAGAATTDADRERGPRLTHRWGEAKLDTVDVPEIGSDAVA